ncbi:hypothetical protein D7M11_17630 [Paenibacillus ginsengarvi]|uniref:Uncharacterized protein n=1 Tax=Paenibacillus ginsengarvi TaxID=400777 RepID=A0A3B0CDT7_9BACL|nr:hypothetical protein D7M11_17630 [Paenibacillus ginsengarvi]
MTEAERHKLELKKLEYEMERLAGGECIPKKVEGNERKERLSRHRQTYVYVAIQSVHEEQGFSVKLLCEVAEMDNPATTSGSTTNPARVSRKTSS